MTEASSWGHRIRPALGRDHEEHTTPFGATDDGVAIQTECNPGGLPIEVFDGFRKRVATDRSQLSRNEKESP
ncbi:hypothetical protein AB0O28_04495 [Microbispora sp. NPDC088329]|uniref:hypothetical protein n=1 Tax=Microbispora sp. NPDC088329 TaxID=3154869 RepID=UPI00342CFF90